MPSHIKSYCILTPTFYGQKCYFWKCKTFHEITNIIIKLFISLSPI